MFQVAMGRFNGTIFMAPTAIVRCRGYTLVLAQRFIATGLIFLVFIAGFFQAAARLSVRCSIGTQRSWLSAYWITSAKAVKLSPPRTTRIQLHRLQARRKWKISWASGLPATVISTCLECVKSLKACRLADILNGT